MAKIQPLKPFLLLLYGYPGSGKTYFARQFSDVVYSAHLQADRVRGELFDEPRYDQQENSVVTQLMNYMSEEFLDAGLSVIYDVNALRGGQRRSLYDLAYRNHAQPLVVWFQMDVDSAFSRNLKRDRRRADDKYSPKWDRTSFEAITAQMQNPRPSEDYVVVSGKHLFNMQQSSVIAKLRQMGVLTDGDVSQRVIKPGMVNLIPATHVRADLAKRNITIR